MPVTAISTPGRPQWRWRISDYAGTLLEESDVSFSTIAGAVAAGRRRLKTMNPALREDFTRQPSPFAFGRRNPRRR